VRAVDKAGNAKESVQFTRRINDHRVDKSPVNDRLNYQLVESANLINRPDNRTQAFESGRHGSEWPWSKTPAGKSFYGKRCIVDIITRLQGASKFRPGYDQEWDHGADHTARPPCR
jgi:hypothetical protein